MHADFTLSFIRTRIFLCLFIRTRIADRMMGLVCWMLLLVCEVKGRAIERGIRGGRGALGEGWRNGCALLLEGWRR